MLSQTLIKSLAFETKGDYFDYAVMSYINGQIKQLKDLIAKMSKADKREFADYLNNCGESDNTKDTILKYVIG